MQINDIPLVSIVITSYNRAHTIEKAIESALGQDYQNLEIIISDNNSTDNTDEVVKKYFDYSIHGKLENADLIDSNGLFVGNHQIKMNEMILLLQETIKTLIEKKKSVPK